MVLEAPRLCTHQPAAMSELKAALAALAGRTAGGTPMSEAATTPKPLTPSALSAHPSWCVEGNVGETIQRCNRLQRSPTSTQMCCLLLSLLVSWVLLPRFRHPQVCASAPSAPAGGAHGGICRPRLLARGVRQPTGTCGCWKAGLCTSLVHPSPCMTLQCHPPRGVSQQPPPAQLDISHHI